MTCSQCATEVPESAAHCPKCGAHLRGDETTTFSYLPAGTPAWPTSVPQKLPYVVDSALATQHPLTGTAVATPPRRSVGKLLIPVAVVLLTLAVGTLGTLGILFSTGQLGSSHPTNARIATNTSPQKAATNPTPAAQSSLPTPTSFKTAKDSGMNVSLQYPSTWTAGPSKQVTSDVMDYPVSPPTSTQVRINLIIERYSTTASSSIQSAASLNSTNLTGLKQLQGVSDVQLQTPATQISIGGIKWDEQDAILTNSGNEKFHFIAYSVLHNNMYYSITTFSLNDYYSEAMQKYIQPILNSVQFLS